MKHIFSCLVLLLSGIVAFGQNPWLRFVDTAATNEFGMPAGEMYEPCWELLQVDAFQFFRSKATPK